MKERVPSRSKEDIPAFLELWNQEQVLITLRLEEIRNCLSKGRSAGGCREYKEMAYGWLREEEGK